MKTLFFFRFFFSLFSSCILVVVGGGFYSIYNVLIRFSLQVSFSYVSRLLEYCTL